MNHWRPLCSIKVWVGDWTSESEIKVGKTWNRIWRTRAAENPKFTGSSQNLGCVYPKLILHRTTRTKKYSNDENNRCMTAGRLSIVHKIFFFWRIPFPFWLRKVSPRSRSATTFCTRTYFLRFVSICRTARYTYVPFRAGLGKSDREWF